MDAELLTGFVLVALVVSLVRELVAPATAMLGALVTLVLLGATTAEAALVGFSSPATATVAGLFIVAKAVGTHGGLDRVLARTLDAAGSPRAVIARLCAPVAVASTVLANTPLVAGLAPAVRSWADRTGTSSSRLLMPLSFAAIIGGTVTTIGTSTTLVASGVVADLTGRPFSFLEVTPLGLPFAVVGTILLVVLAPRLVPVRDETFHQPGGRSYSLRMVVVPGGPADGRTIADAGLRDLDGVFLAAVDRGDAGRTPARPDSRLNGGDEVVVVGDVDHLSSLELNGLAPASQGQVRALGEDRTGLVELVLGPNSPAVHRTLKELSFRGRYGAAVLGIARAGELIEGQLGQVLLQPGDALLVQAGPSFTDRWRDSGEFAIVAPLETSDTAVSPRRGLVLVTALLMVVVAAAGLLSLLEAVLWACVVLVVSRTLGFRESIDALDVDVLLIIASAIGIGATVAASGLATRVAQGVASVAADTTPVLGLLLLLLVTALLTEIVTNVASAALMVPVALQTAESLGEDPRAWAVAVALGASASFLTPIGYQTNTLVYGLGGYRFGDYWRLGAPLVVAWLAIALSVTNLG